MAKRLIKHHTTTVNRDTGEVTDEQKTYTITVKDTSRFYITYIDNISGFLKIRNTIDMRVLALLCCHANIDTGVVSLTTTRRKDILEELGLNTQNMSNILNRLKGLNLISGSGGEFLINPNCFWRGSEASRQKILQNTGVHFKLSFISEKNT